MLFELPQKPIPHHHQLPSVTIVQYNIKEFKYPNAFLSVNNQYKFDTTEAGLL